MLISDAPNQHLYTIGQRAESRVFVALSTLPAPWLFFSTVEWRLLQRDGESIGEADVVVFHPAYGLVVFEIKAGEVAVRNGSWYYGSGLPMKQSPMAQARRNRYALQEKLRQRLGMGADALIVTHAVWFPEITWKASAPMEIPSRHFLLDRNALKAPESALLALLREAAPNGPAWSRSQQQALKELLAPDCHLLVPLSVQVDSTLESLHQATEQQMSVLRMLRSQSRLLVEGGAGTGKTLLACMLAREHAAQGKSVLVTCFNKQLANHLAACLADCHEVQVTNFHELVHQMATQAGLPYEIIDNPEQRARFFRDGAAELLLNASELLTVRFDTLIVDEAMDFASTWWIALSALGRDNFGWYCFYDRQQAIYQHGSTWEAPFVAAPMQLETNLRNPKPIGEFAAHIAQYPMPAAFRVLSGALPITLRSADFDIMSGQLRSLLHELTQKENITPEQIVILSPYRMENAKSAWRTGLSQFNTSADMATPSTGKIRVGTIQGFKGLEADVVILVGIDANAAKHPDWLYIGASRARAILYLLALEEFPDFSE
ncbi:nuclease-related domain-containing DEAD/DEAH box helicase [Azonexus hydrophilus]|uniref:nuclease-related domain-containing DEAD/DEAH box helicase n=1 Tax=Azonexus hydrophilus TaxID=418702 RepID=UPI00041682E1|nr:ATP-binding domain-containing protein [Azonexus hydrophilus]